MRRALLAAALLLAMGCDSGPTEPNRTQTLTGSLARSAATESALTMRHTGNLRVLGEDFKQVAADGTETTTGAGLTFSIGTFGTDAACVASGNFGLLKGSVLSLGLNRGDYCVKLTEPTLVAEGATLEYTVRLEITD
jgi:hypothetical protein